MEIVLVRHGQPEWVRNGLNVVDPPLTALGHQQAELSGTALARETFDHIVVSPLRRARQTVEPVLRLLGRDEVVEPFLEEIREPDWHGTPEELAHAAYAEERSRAAADRWHGVHGGGEPPRDFVERVRLGATDFWARLGMSRSMQTLPMWHIERPEQRVLIVAHSGTNGVLLCQLLGLDPVPWEWDRFVTQHASITRLVSLELGDGHTFSLRRLSDVEHFPAEARTL
jgi:probable phosphoglycerate mutase